MSHIKNILTITSLSMLLTSAAMAATPATPGPYVGVYNVTENSARISFLDNASDEDGFKVYVYNNTDGVLDPTIQPNPIIVQKNDSGSQYQYANLTGLSPESFYEVKVSAFNSDGESALTNPSSEQGGRLTTVQTCKPEMPGEYVGVWNVTNSGARISFKDNSDNEDGFKVYVYNYNTNELVDTLYLDAKASKGGFQYANIDCLDDNTIYKVSVSAYNDCGESKKTTPSSATNGRFKTTQIPCPAMPGEYVGVYNVTNDSARISFLDNSDNESGFRAYVYEYDTNVLVKTIDMPAVSGVGKYQYSNITGLKPDTKYQVRVSAYNCDCESPKTNPSSVTNGRFKTNQ
ncbi:MAG TPA: fibronectin type III domain-containing protein [Nitratifractor sp.]|nr:fibronectin type III domain-containing protein [Nitratifractor sp.]